MLPIAHQIAFLLFAAVTGLIGLRGFYRLYRRIRAGRPDADARWDKLPSRLWYALRTTLLQSRTFRKRPVVSAFHAFIFYGFVFYLLVNAIDGAEGFVSLSIRSTSWPGSAYNLFADLLSLLVLIGVVALVARRFFLPAKRDFRFNQNTLLHDDVQRNFIRVDSLLVSSFILLHVGSRAIGAGAKLALEGPDRFQPFATLLAHAFSPVHAVAWRIFGYWGALGSVLAFLIYLPYSKHTHTFMAPAKFLVAREFGSGVLPPLDVNVDATTTEEEPKLGANKLEDLGWPRLLDAFACIQCNRCQDVCPAAATGKSLSPAALEINKRMELNSLARHTPDFESGAPSPRPLLEFALSPQALWACTTCGACMEACPVQNEQMLDIIDMRRNQVMMQGDFPVQLQSSFRGMERSKNPWGINHDQRFAWADGLNVKTIEQNPDPDVLYWVGCAASYDPQAQKTARAFIQLLNHAGVNFAVLGKKECCTGDSARRAGNEYLYHQLASQNVATLNAVQPKLIVATCPHCMNAIGKEYRQLGGNYTVMHHSEYLESLLAEGRLVAEAMPSSVTYHDPCYLGRHNGVFDAPRNVLRVLSNDFVELDRHRENSFCCGAGGAQFWKEEEAGTERITDNRYREIEQQLAARSDTKILAVGCPFCKSMLGSTSCKDEKIPIEIKDIAELLLEGVLKKFGQTALAKPAVTLLPTLPDKLVVASAVAKSAPLGTDLQAAESLSSESSASAVVVPTEAPSAVSERRKWTPKRPPNGNGLAQSEEPAEPASSVAAVHVSPRNVVKAPEAPSRKKWTPKGAPPEENS